MAVGEREITETGAPAAADVRLERLTKRFDEVVAVEDVSLAVERGKFFALPGPSGCGKTTTLRMIGGCFEEPTAGIIYLGDREVTGLPPYRRDVNPTTSTSIRRPRSSQGSWESPRTSSSSFRLPRRRSSSARRC
jgi:ABC-type glutathione transport system ATPase component